MGGGGAFCLCVTMELIYLGYRRRLHKHCPFKGDCTGILKQIMGGGVGTE